MSMRAMAASLLGLVAVGWSAVADPGADAATKTYTNADLAIARGSMTVTSAEGDPVSAELDAVPEPDGPDPAEVRRLRAHHRKLTARMESVEAQIPQVREAAARESDAFWVIRNAKRPSDKAKARLARLEAELARLEEETAEVELEAHRLGIGSASLAAD